jgi:hypothetical protein
MGVDTEDTGSQVQAKKKKVRISENPFAWKFENVNGDRDKEWRMNDNGTLNIIHLLNFTLLKPHLIPGSILRRYSSRHHCTFFLTGTYLQQIVNIYRTDGLDRELESRNKNAIWEF